MRQFTEIELCQCWQAVKKGGTKKHIMKLFGISAEEASRMYEEAYNIYCRKGYHKPKNITPAICDPPPAETPPAGKIKRSAAKYDNMSREDYINKYLVMNI